MAEMPKTDFTGETPRREFWRDLQPIQRVFRPGALPEAYIADAPTDDDEDASTGSNTDEDPEPPSSADLIDMFTALGSGLVGLG